MIGGLDIGPRAHEREPRLTPEGVQLADSSPLYYVLLENPNTINLSTSETQAARSRLSRIIEINREKVLSCQGKTRDEAKAILKSIEFSQSN